MRRWLGLLCLPGCTLYFGDPQGSGNGNGGDPVVDAGTPANVIAKPCIRAVAVADFMLGGHDEIFLTWVCDAPGAGAIIENLWWTNGALYEDTPHADFQQPFVRVTPVEPNGQPPANLLILQQYTPSGWVWGGGGGFRFDSQRPFTDATLALLSSTTPSYSPDIVLAGDNAIRVRHGMFPMTEPELVSGKPFASVAVLDLGGTTAPDLFFIAASSTGNELGTALQTGPDTFTLGTVTPDPPGPVLPLVVADIDGDHKPDVIGGTSHVFVRSSKTGMLTFLAEAPAALAATDLDDDGVTDAIFLTADKTQVRRIRVDASGQLSSSLLLAEGGDALAAGDLDGDHRGDIILLHGVGQTTSTMSVHLATMY